jgi:hypothetical protein
VAVVVFHVTTWLLFPIGVFPWVMLAAATLFFAPAWPRRWIPSRNRAVAVRVPAVHAPLDSVSASRPAGWSSKLGLVLAGVFVVVQLLVPLRFVLYPGWVLWTEEGFRFAWRVMLVEKNGMTEFEVTSTSPPRRFRVYPRSELTELQYRMMSTQPDMIHQYALHLRERYASRGLSNVRVAADSWVALNGRSARRLIDPRDDLGSMPQRVVARTPFILPLPDTFGPQREAASQEPLGEL